MTVGRSLTYFPTLVPGHYCGVSEVHLELQTMAAAELELKSPSVPRSCEKIAEI
jgi:hypothetical protein